MYAPAAAFELLNKRMLLVNLLHQLFWCYAQTSADMLPAGLDKV